MIEIFSLGEFQFLLRKRSDDIIKMQNVYLENLRPRGSTEDKRKSRKPS